MLFLWESEFFRDYSNGQIVALGNTLEEAKENALEGRATE